MYVLRDVSSLLEKVQIIVLLTALSVLIGSKSGVNCPDGEPKWAGHLYFSEQSQMPWTVLCPFGLPEIYARIVRQIFKFVIPSPAIRFELSGSLLAG